MDYLSLDNESLIICEIRLYTYILIYIIYISIIITHMYSIYIYNDITNINNTFTCRFHFCYYYK